MTPRPDWFDVVRWVILVAVVLAAVTAPLWVGK